MGLDCTVQEVITGRDFVVGCFGKIALPFRTSVLSDPSRGKMVHHFNTVWLSIIFTGKGDLKL